MIKLIRLLRFSAVNPRLSLRKFSAFHDKLVDSILIKYSDNQLLSQADFYSLTRELANISEKSTQKRIEEKQNQFLKQSLFKENLNEPEFMLYFLRQSQINFTTNDTSVLEFFFSSAIKRYMFQMDDSLGQLLEAYYNFSRKSSPPKLNEFRDFVIGRTLNDIKSANSNKMFQLLRVLIFMDNEIIDELKSALNDKFVSSFVNEEFDFAELLSAYHLIPKLLSPENVSYYKKFLIQNKDREVNPEVLALSVINLTLFTDDFADLTAEFVSIFNTNLTAYSPELHLEMFFLPLRSEIPRGYNKKVYASLVRNAAILLDEAKFNFDATLPGDSRELVWIRQRVENFSAAYDGYKKQNEHRLTPEFQRSSVMMENVIEKNCLRYVPSEGEITNIKLGIFLERLNEIIRFNNI